VRRKYAGRSTSSKALSKGTGRLHSKVALVTGASRGIGLAIAHAFAAEGCDVVLSSRQQSSIENAGRELQPYKTRTASIACDITNASDVDSMFAFVRREFGRLDILVNNAGISHAMAPVDQLEPDLWEQVLATNLTGMFLVTRGAIPLMKAGATIVNNLSVAARGVFAGEAAYVASKHGALGLTNTLREELRPRGIRVMALMPGPTDTDIWNQFWPEAPRAKMMSPETVAAVLVNALLLPPNSSLDELVINPSSGSL
jgi:NAD(P)-dependent dehydrogenase (short-subunit alcohol dehydrogenase family)